MSDHALTLIQRHVDALDAMALSEDAILPEPPDLTGMSIDVDDLDRARELLRIIAAAEQRLSGMRVRLRGEIEGLRRPHRDALAPAPRVLDTSA